MKRLAVLLFLVATSAFAGISADAQYKLNHGSKLFSDVQLGTLIKNSENAPTGITLTDTHIMVGDGTGHAADVALSGDATMADTGAITIANLAVTTAKINTAAVTVAKEDPAIMVEATGTLSQANLVAMNGAPVTLIAAPGAGKLIIVDEIELLHTYSTAAYTNGGDVSVQYHTSAVAVQVFDVAVVTGAATANYLMRPTAAYTSTSGTASETDLSTSVNKALEITNASAAFAAGNVANIFKYRVRYHVVTVLT